MILNKEFVKNTTKTDRELFVRVMDIFLVTQKYVQNNLQDTKLPTFECHSTCRAIVEHIDKLKVADGHYLGVSKKRGKTSGVKLEFCAHSWLVTPSGSIIDPYPVGFLSANPVLVINRGNYKSFGGNLYWKDEKVTEVVNTEELRERVKVLSHIITVACVKIIYG